MTSFQVYIGTTWTTPPSYAMPVGLGNSDIQNPPVVRRHEPQGRDGYGRPVNTNSELWAIIGRPTITSAGLGWWHTTVGLGSNVSTQITLRLWDPLTQAWVAYTGLAWRPTWTAARGGYKLTNFAIYITNLVPV